MIVPAKLKKGDKVAIVLTARSMQRRELRVAVELFESWGLEVVYGKTIEKVQDQFAGSDELRTQDFQTMLDDPKVKAIFCGRGGYGTVRMVDGLDWSRFLKQPKWIVGFSDITVLHNCMANFKMPSLHAIMPSTISYSNPQSIRSLKKGLWGKKLEYEWEAHKLNKVGEVKGKIVGGNLSVLYSQLGSSTSIDPEGHILFVEDLDEYLYHIDRMMINLKRSGFLANLAGLIVGGFTDMRDNDIPFGKTAYQIISEHTSSYSYPIAFDCPSGHQKDNRALKLGSTASLIVNAKLVKLTI